MSNLKNAMFSGIAFFATVGVLAVAHSAYVANYPAIAASGGTLSSSEWNRMVTSLTTLDEKLSVFKISGDNVGIGTPTPWTSLYVKSTQGASIPHPFRAGIITAAEWTSVGGRFMAQTNSDVEIPGLFTQRSRGTLASPTALQANDQLLFLNGHWYDGTEYVGVGQAGISFVASENWSPTNHWTHMVFLTTNTWAVSYSEKMRLNSVGNLWIGTTTPQAKLDVNGMIKVMADNTAPTSSTDTVPESYKYSRSDCNASTRWSMFVGRFSGDPNQDWLCVCMNINAVMEWACFNP